MCSVIDALQAAAATRSGDLRGARYTSAAFVAACANLVAIQSMEAIGTSAAAEAFNAALKSGTLQGTKHWTSARHARLAVFEWIMR